MKLTAEVDTETFDVEVRYDGDRLIAEVNGRHYDLEVSEPESNSYLIKHEGRIYEALVSPVNDAQGKTNVTIRNEQFAIKLVDPKLLRSSGSDATAADGPAEIRTAMPGKIVRVLVDVGSEVEKGQGIIVVEAMKMQNELRSPKAGTVREIRFAVDSTVSSGDVLVTIE